MNSLTAICIATQCMHASASDARIEPRVRLVIQRVMVAGLRYHEASAMWPQLRVGMPVELLREPDNPHDASAVRVQVPSGVLGYVSRRDNSVLAWALDQGQPIGGKIERLEKLRNGARRVEIEVYAE